MGGPAMIKKNTREERANNDARITHQELMAHAIKLLGSEERARAMLTAGTLHLLVPKVRRVPDSARKLCGASARSTGKTCQAPGKGRGGRCKLHGGMSTGPKTEQGQQRLREAMRRRWLSKRGD
jgi:hypothetical protein